MTAEKKKMQGQTKETYTKYEIARIIGARALQISMNAPILLAISKEELERINYDPLKIAEREFKAAVLPITVKRPFPQPKEEEAAVPVATIKVEEKREEVAEVPEELIEAAEVVEEPEEAEEKEEAIE